MPDETVEKVSRSRVVLTTTPLSVEETQKLTGPNTIEEQGGVATKDANISDIEAEEEKE